MSASHAITSRTAASPARSTRQRPPASATPAVAMGDGSRNMAARQGGCACGGGCPACAAARVELHGSASASANEAEAERAAHFATAAPHGTLVAPRPLPPTRPAHGIGSAGRPLPAPQRQALEQAYGWQLGSVRLHDAPAERGHAHAIGARAFASGAHIVHAGSGAEPQRRVLAHEVAHVVQAALHPGAPPVQRYEAAEHADLGDTALEDLLAFLQTPAGMEWAKAHELDANTLVSSIKADPLRKAGSKIRVGKRKVGADGTEQAVELTPGEIIAMAGDLYAGPEGIAAAASKPLAKAGGQNEIDQLQAAIGKERKGQLEDPNQTYQKITGGRYLDLAKQNDEHFAPLNRAEWRRLHEQALAEATAAGLRQRAKPAKGATQVAWSGDDALHHALLVDAAAGHFLTDAYAAGHLFRKNELMAAISLHLAKHPLGTQNPESQLYAGIVTVSGNAGQMVLKNIHDRLNREGFDVTNARGMAWRTFGDTQLAKAPETRRIASLALFLARQQVYAAHRGETPDPAEVAALMPDDATLQKATQKAIGAIPAAASALDIEGLMFRGRKLAATQFPWPLGTIVESNLSTIADPGREKMLLDLQQSGTNNPSTGGRLAPQFTVGSF